MEGDAPTVDFLILADRAEAVGGKIYMMGGGWDRLYVHDFNQPVVFSVAVGILVPWTCTNEQHSIELQVQDADANVIVPPATLSFVAGRPPFMRSGESQRVLMAINGSFKLPRPGAYVVAASVGGRESRRTVFYAAQAQAQPPPAPPAR